MESKKWYLSKTIVGAFVALIGGILHATGLSDALTCTAEQAELVELFLEVVGFVLVLIGRSKTETKITM